VNRMFDLKQATKVGLFLTSDIEGSGFGQITGNSDGFGISAGALQWTYRFGDMQRLMKLGLKKNSKIIRQYMPRTAQDWLNIMDYPLNAGTLEVAKLSDAHGVIEPHYSELKALWSCPEMIEVQISQADAFAKHAMLYSNDWCQARDFAKGQFGPSAEPTLREFCFFFDLCVNNGSLLGLDYKDCEQLIELSSLDNVINVIIEWCQNTLPEVHQSSQVLKNCDLWTELLKTASMDDKYLFILGWLRSKKARPEYQAVVMNRRGLFALGQSYLNGALHNFDQMVSRLK
jgi:hypothetical protein